MILATNITLQRFGNSKVKETRYERNDIDVLMLIRILDTALDAKDMRGNCVFVFLLSLFRPASCPPSRSPSFFNKCRFSAIYR